jgi:4-hydroxythreonine-4-phosphate dehydrogenase
MTLRIAVTPGEPAGIGPDLCIMLAQQPWEQELVIIADPDLLQARAAELGLPLQIVPFAADRPAAASAAGRLTVLPVPLRAPVTSGRLDPANAPYVLDTLDQAIAGCRAGRFAALVTGPVHKGVINDAGVPFSGHTEFLAGLAGVPRVVMMLVAGDLRVALVTTHLALRDVPDAITVEAVTETIRISHAELRLRFSLPAPHIQVLGLNPHAGEGGHLGTEDRAIIAPAIEACLAEGLSVSGPVPADTAFTPRALDGCDCVIAMYHDQGLPVIKHVGFGRAVNVTLGLPFIRTSVDHGTALDIAGRGLADASSLYHAALLAQNMCRESIV